MKLGLVLSGGGIRGAAHLGAIKALEEHGISPNYIAGTSAGAIVGALYAYGYKWDDILTFFSKTQIIDLKKFAINKPGFIDAEKFYSSFKTYLKHDDFGSLKKHLKVTAANILNGNLEVFEAGELIKPVIASSAIPGLFSPVKINDNYYVDGGALNNFPVELLKDTCDVIIGVYVNGFVPITINELKYSHNVVERAFKLKQVKEDQLKFKDCDLVIYPKELSKYGTFDKKHLHEIFAIGYEAAMKVLTNNTDFKNKIFKK